MRYIYYIIGILAVLSVLIGYLLMPPAAREKKAALVINGKVITPEEFDTLYASRRPGVGKAAFINSLVTRELLIQESEREGIDKEEPFRISIRNYYEQSLVKLLTDRKFASLHPDVPEGEVDRYLALAGKSLRLTIFSFSDLGAAERGASKNGERRTLFLSDLSPGMRAAVSSLRPGESSRPFRSGEGYLIVRLDGIKSGKPGARPPDREEVRKMLEGEKKEAMMNEWIAGLRKKAAVRILVKE